jgi:internalin A
MRGSLGALMVVVILSSTARADEADAVKLVEKLGGKITRDDKQPGKPVVEVNLSLKKVTDADLKELKELKQLASLNLFGCREVTDAGVKELKELKQLTSLILMRTQVTEAGVKELKDLKQLTKLILGGTQGTDAGLKELKDLKLLTELRVIGSPVTVAGLRQLSSSRAGSMRPRRSPFLAPGRRPSRRSPKTRRTPGRQR